MPSDQNDEKPGAGPPRGAGPQRFQYIKGNFYRVIHVDGAWGGITPKGNIHVSFYNERGSIPKETIREFENGRLLAEKVEKAFPGLTREVEASVIMDINTAIEFHKWFADKLEALRSAMGIPDAEWNELTKKKPSDGSTGD